MTTNYQIIMDETVLDTHLNALPDLLPHEVWYACLFGRHKYDHNFPNTKDAGQLARVAARDKGELKEKLRRMEVPLGTYMRDGISASQGCLAAYMAMNPRSLIKANQLLLIELAKRFADNQVDFNPISLSTTMIHQATDRKFYIDFDFDHADPLEHIPLIKEILPNQQMYQVLRTRGGFHLLVDLGRLRACKIRPDWYPALCRLPGCDVRGSDTLTPIPGCTQGGFVPNYL